MPTAQLSHPKISIIIPSNRSGSAENTIRAIMEGNACPLEIILVDQSRDGTYHHNLEGSGLLSDPRMIHVPTETIGASRARNIGINKASASLLAFTDDDCIPQARWADKLVQIFEENPDMDVLFAGVIKGREDESGSWTPTFVPSREGRVKERAPSIWDFGLSANLSAKAEVLRSIAGPFDVQRGPGTARYGEDTVLGYRLVRLGYAVYCLAEPSVVHLGSRSGREKDILRRNYALAVGDVYGQQVLEGNVGVALHLLAELTRDVGEALRGCLTPPHRPSGLKPLVWKLQGFWRNFSA